MWAATNNYNSLGKVGPHYERPEYRPPREADPERSPAAGAREQGDRRTLSTQNTLVAPKTAAPQPTGKLSLDSARDLTANTCSLIQSLPPQSTTREPHGWLPSSLMAPTYA